MQTVLLVQTAKMMQDETDMLELVFITYVLAMIALILGIWLWSEIRDIKKAVYSKKKPKVYAPKPSTKPARPKGLWD